VALVFSNHAETQLAAPLLVSDTTMTLPTGESALFNTLNVGETELVVITDGVQFETVEITSWNGDIATITRSVEGVAQAWATGSIVSGRLTAKALNSLAQRADIKAIVAAELAAAGGGGTATSSPVKTSVVQIPVGATTFDMSSYNADLTTLPEIVLIDWARTSVVLVTLPSLSSLLVGQVVVLDFVIEDSNPVWSFHVDFAVQQGEYKNNTLNGTDYASYSNYTRWHGYKAADGTLHWVY